MKMKIIGILICMLFLSTGFASAFNTLELNNEKNVEETAFNRVIVIGRMEKINFTGDKIDFEVVSFLFIKEGKEIHQVQKGETVRFFSPMVAVLFRNMVIGRFSDWELIE
jgi:hypothetical protein